MGEILFEMAGELRGKDYPDIPLPDDIDREALGADAMFVTLPIMPKGARSRNGRIYDGAMVESIVRQVNENRPEGQWGHLKLTELDSTYNRPALRALAATFDADGMAWGKFLAITPDAREHFRIAKATNAKVATSIWGDPVMEKGKLVDVKLHKIDIADPARAGIASAVAVPVITAEMAGEGTSDMDETQIAEMTAERERLQEQVTTLTSQIAEMTPAFEMVSELRGIVGSEDVVSTVKEMVAEVAQLKRAGLDAKIEALVAESVPLEDMRGYVAEMVGPAETLDAAKARIGQVMEGATYQALAKKIAIAEQGPAAIVGSKGKEDGGAAAKDKSLEEGLKWAEQISGGRVSPPANGG